MDVMERNTDIAKQIPEYGEPYKVNAEFYAKMKNGQLYVFRISEGQPYWVFCGSYREEK
jgi:hypothetical protein